MSLTINIFAYLKANGYDSSIYNVAVNGETYTDWINKICSNSINITKEIPKNGNILLMSTCASEETDGRRLLAASITPGGTSAENDKNNYASNSVFSDIIK